MKKILLVLLIINCFAFGKAKIKYDYESTEINQTLVNSKINYILSNFKNINYNNESFYLKGTCYINSLGVLKYRLIKESDEGYNNKILIVNKLEELKKDEYEDIRKIINQYDIKNKYKDIIFTFEIEQK